MLHSLNREFLLVKHARILEEALHQIIIHESGKVAPDYEILALAKIAVSNTTKDICKDVDSPK